MSEKAYAERLARAIESLGCTEVIRSTFGDNVVTVLFRVTSKYQDGKPDERPLLSALERVVLHDPEGKGPWLCHVCSRLLPKQVDGKWKMVKGWSIAISSSSLDQVLDKVSRLIRGDKEPVQGKIKELTEFPLVGVGPSRQSPKKEGPGKGKGAWTVSGDDDFKLK